MSTHIIHRVQGDLAPPVNFELVDTDISGWTIQLQGTYRDTFQEIDIAHTPDVAADGKGHFDWGATDLVKGVADWEMFFTPAGGSPKPFTIPAENSLLLQVRGKKEPGPGVLSGGGDQITITQDNRTLKIFGASGASADEKVKASPADTTPGDLAAKIVDAAGIVSTILNPAGDEQRSMGADFGTGAGKVTEGDDSRLGDDRTADGIRTATTIVGVAAATAPTAGQVLTASSPTDADWQTPSAGVPDPIVPADGTQNITGKISVRASGGAAGSEQYGAAANASAVDATAVGDSSSAAVDGTAVGKSAVAVQNSVSIGKNATTAVNLSTAVGEGASAVERGVAVGQLTSAGGFNSTAVGRAASAVGDQSTALGQGSFAASTNALAIGRNTNASADSAAVGTNAVSSVDAVAVGNSANAGVEGGIALGESASALPTHTNAVAIGKNSLTTAAQRTTLGKVGGTASEIQDLQISGGFGANGTTPLVAPSVTGSRGGNAALASLLTTLASIGLITDNTTA